MIGVFIAPLSGRISNRFGNGVTLATGAVVFAGSLGVTHIPDLAAVCLGLCGVCLGFFSVHSAAVGNMVIPFLLFKPAQWSYYQMFYHTETHDTA